MMDHSPKPDKVPGVRRPPHERCEICQPTKPVAPPLQAVGAPSRWRSSGKSFLDVVSGVTRISKHRRGRMPSPRRKAR